MKIPANANTKFLRGIIADLRDENIKLNIHTHNLQQVALDEATDNVAHWVDAADVMQGKLNMAVARARVNLWGEWARTLVLVASGFFIGWIAW